MRFINMRLSVHQYRDLLDLVFLGHYLAQGCSESADKRYEDVCQHVLSLNSPLAIWPKRERRRMAKNGLKSTLQ